MIKFIIFDMDGTLVDTIKGIEKGLNSALKILGYKSHYSYDEVKSFIGNGARVLFLKATKKDLIDEKEYQIYLNEYRDHQKYSEIYEGCIDFLIKAKRAGIKLFIHSNKPDILLQILVDDLNLREYFLEIKGENGGFRRKPDIEFIKYLENKYQLNLDEGVYVGDSIVDLETAKNAKIKSIIFKDGYGNKEEIIKGSPDYFIDDFYQLKEIVFNDKK